MQISGRNAIVTGASRGIGRATALRLASLGANIAVIYSGNEAAAAETVEKCIELGVKAKAYRCDVSSAEETKNAVQEIRKDFGSVEILVNNAGITKDGLIAFMKEEDFDRVIDVNLKGAFNMIRNTAALMLRSKCGRIVNISSVSGIMGNAGQANYSASKAGVIGLTKSVARELASKGITCNAVAPGFIETDMTRDIPAEDNPLLSSIPLGHMGKAEDVADAVAFLVSSDYITGEILKVDGGIAM